MWVQTTVCAQPTLEFTMTFKSPVLFIASAALALLAACASMSSAPAKMADGVLVGPNGITLYTFDKDVACIGKSVCNGKPGDKTGDGFNKVWQVARP